MKSNETNSSKKNTDIRKRVWLALLPPVLLCLASLCILILQSTSIKSALTDSSRGALYYAYIYQDGECTHVLDLSEDAQLTLFFGDSDYNIIRIQDGGIQISEATCPDKICVNTGRIDSSLLPIVCLPHRLVIRVEKQEAIKPDTITY